MRIRPPFAIFLLVLLLFGFHLRFAHAQTSPAPSIVTIDGLGKGTVDLSGPWRFHIGDDLRWADASISDTPGENGWETILPDRPWGAQRHYAYTGFAWYRLYLRITPAPDVKSDFQLLLPALQDVCEVYWNGRLVGRYGKLPPHPSSPALSAFSNSRYALHIDCRVHRHLELQFPAQHSLHQLAEHSLLFRSPGSLRPVAPA